MIGTVQEASFSKGGKPKAKIDGKWYFMADGVDVPSLIGKKIDFEPGQFSIQTNQGPKWLDSVKNWMLCPASEQNQPQAAPQRVEPVAPTSPAPVQSGAQTEEPRQRALSTLYDHELRFLSNVVGQAIYGGQIKEPGQIRAWFDAARDALAGHGQRPDRSAQTKKANEQAGRILEAIRKGLETAAFEVWQECSHLVTSEEFATAVWVQLPTPVQNRLKDMEDAAKRDPDDPGF